jgi:uncharacterized protein (TIGR02145 family)
MMKSQRIPISWMGVIVFCLLPITGCEKNEAPSCTITAPVDGDVIMQGVTVTISVDATDSDDEIVVVEFFIDDESKGSVNSAPYEYDWDTSDESPGNYTLKAVSRDDEEASTSAEISIEIVEAVDAPLSAFIAEPTYGDAPLEVQFTDQSENDPDSWLWDFGDGNSSTDQHPSNTYQDIGIYTVSLTTSNLAGSDTQTEEDYIVVGVAAAGFSSSPSGGQAPLTVDFSDESGNNPTSWLWDFGDGSTSTDQSPTHTYTTMGLYDVSLTVSNEHGSHTLTEEEFIAVHGGDESVLIDARDEQSYELTPIGDQVWFAQNLNYEMTDSWWYDNLPENGYAYGRLYTWEAALEGCPDGWHLPTDEEWKILEGNVDSQFGVGDPEWDGTSSRGFDAGWKLKSVDGWDTNNGTDEYGFHALPGGSYYDTEGIFDFIGQEGNFWTSTETSPQSSSAYMRNLYMSYKKIGRYYWAKKNACSVRCIRDE